MKDLHGRQIRVNYATEKRQGFRGGGYTGPRGYGDAGYGGSSDQSGNGQDYIV